MKISRICITGSNGFIGQNLIRRLLSYSKYEITAVVRTIPAADCLDGINYYKDTGNTEDLICFFEKNKFDAVIHLASLYLKEHESSQLRELVESNIIFGIRLLEASVKAGVKFFINTGTFWQHYQNEKYSPVNLYSATKQAFEDIAKYYIETSNLYFVNLKINDTFGPNDTRKKIVNLLLNVGINETLKMSPGEQMIDILYIDDVVEGFNKLLIQIEEDYPNKKYVGKSFALHSNEIVKLKDFVRIFESVIGKELNIEWGALPYRKREVMVPWIGGEAVNDWHPNVSLECGIRKLFDDK